MQSGNLVNAAADEKLGDYKEEYFIDCVDYEYCLRAKRYGTYRIVQCGSAVLKHQPAVTCEKSL